MLRRGEDFDQVVLAASLGMVELVAAELIADRPEWREMTTHVRTVATQAFQLWLTPGRVGAGVEPARGDHQRVRLTVRHLGVDAADTVGREAGRDPRNRGPSHTSAERSTPSGRRPTIREYYVRRCRERVFANAVDYLDHHLGLYLPGAVTEGGFSWGLLAGAGGLRGAAALQTQHVSVNIDPSDRYVLSVPGSDKYRLRPDESGYDNLVLAGDWTDCGINAGCIEAAVMSGLQAANAVLGHGRYHRIRGFYMP